MKGNTKVLAQFLAALLALLAIGMHWGIIVIPLLAGYKFSMVTIAFLLLFASTLF